MRVNSRWEWEVEECNGWFKEVSDCKHFYGYTDCPAIIKVCNEPIVGFPYTVVTYDYQEGIITDMQGLPFKYNTTFRVVETNGSEEGYEVYMKSQL